MSNEKLQQRLETEAIEAVNILSAIMKDESAKEYARTAAAKAILAHGQCELRKENARLKVELDEVQGRGRILAAIGQIQAQRIAVDLGLESSDLIGDASDGQSAVH